MRERVVERALQLFARHGYDGTSMADIAAAVDVTKAALYHHFPSKEQLYLAAMTEMADRLEREIDEGTTAGSEPPEHLRSVVHAHLGLFRRHPDLIRALYHNLLTPSVPACAAVAVDTETPLHRALRACADAGYLTSEEIPDVFVLLKGGIEYLGVRWLLDPTAPEPSPERGDRLVKRLLPRLAASALAVFLVTDPVAADSDSLDPVLPEVKPVVVIAGDAPTINLGLCIDEIVEFNAGLEAVREGREEVRGQLWQARATGLPKLDAVGTWSRSRDPSFALDETFGAPEGATDSNAFIVRPEDIPPQTFWRASVDANWEINPAQVVNAIGGAKLGIARQEASITGAEHRLLERGVETYARILRTWESVLAAEAEIRAREEFLDITRRRYRLDIATALDTLQAAVSLANVAPALRRANGDLKSFGAELNSLMGRPPRSPLRLDPHVPVETDAIDEDLALELADSRPDLRELDYTIAIQRKNRGVRKSESRPRLSLDGSYGFVARDFADLGEEGKDSWRASATVTVPIFDGFLTRGRVREVEAGIRQLELEREESARQVRSEVLQIVSDLDVSRANLTAAALNIQQSEDALRYTTLRYENGKSDYLSVLNAETERANARQNYIQARYEVLSHTASLKRAMGLSPMASLAAAEEAAGKRRANRMEGRSE